MTETNKRISFESTSPQDLPSNVKDKFISRGSLYINKQTAPKSMDDFENVRRVVHANGDISYLANQNKIYSSGAQEETIHLVDTTAESRLTGEAEVRFNSASEEDYFKDKPFVGWTSTEKEARHEGLGRRRLIVMKFAAAAEFGLALHSDTVFSHEDVGKIWERLVDEGQAEQYIQPDSAGNNLRYKFN